MPSSDVRDAADDATTPQPICRAPREEACGEGGDGCRAPSQGACGDGVDNDCDGEIDEECARFIAQSASFRLNCGLNRAGLIQCNGKHIEAMLNPVTEGYPLLVDIGIGYHASCGLEESGSIRCWGDLAPHSLGSSIPENDPSDPFVELDTSIYGVCARTRAGRIECGGGIAITEGVPADRPYDLLSCDISDCCAAGAGGIECWGALRNDAPANELWFRAEPPSFPVRDLEVGLRFACAVSLEGEVACWGILPAEVPEDLGAARAVGVFQFGGCAALEAGGIECWGNDDLGVISDAPKEGTFVSLSGDTTMMCAIEVGGARTCWGYDEGDLLKAPAGSFAKLASGTRHFCALDEQGAITCWGNARLDRLRAPDRPAREVIAMLRGGCALARDSDEVFCWGKSPYPEFTPPDTLPGFIDWDSDLEHACALYEPSPGAKEITCWGRNHKNQLDVPPELSSDLVGVATGADFSCALDAAGSIQCWGNPGGKRLAPPDAPLDDPWIRIDAGFVAGCAQSRAGAIACWGGSGISPPPASIRSGSDPGSLSVSFDLGCALYDRIPRCWGGSGAGRTEPYNVPLTIVRPAHVTTCGLDTDGAIQCW